MSVIFKEHRREAILDFFQHDVACGIIHLKNGDSFTFYNGEFKPLSYSSKNENTIMQAVCSLNEKLTLDQ